MEINLKIDYEDNPYLELSADKCDSRKLEDDLLELFIREAREKGIIIKNEAYEKIRTDYASIRIKE